ncbi:MAG: DMT family transporter [Pseudomonadota bacterium]
MDPKTPKNTMAQAALLMVVAVLFFSMMDAVARGLARDVHPFEVVWGRYTFQTLFSVIFLAPQLHIYIKTSNLGLQFTRSLFLFGGTFFFFTALSHLSLAMTTAIFEIAPLLITVLAIFVLGEKVGAYRIAAVLIGLMGTLIIIRPTSAAFEPTLLLPIAAAACYAAYAISTRVLGDADPEWTSFLYTAVIGTVIAAIVVPLYWTGPDLWSFARMALMGIFGSFAHYLLILAFTRGEASYIAPFGYFGLVFNATWGFLFYAERPDLFVIIGAVIIVGAGLFVWYRENRSGFARHH